MIFQICKNKDQLKKQSSFQDSFTTSESTKVGAPTQGEGAGMDGSLDTDLGGWDKENPSVVSPCHRSKRSVQQSCSNKCHENHEIGPKNNQDMKQNFHLQSSLRFAGLKNRLSLQTASSRWIGLLQHLERRSQQNWRTSPSLHAVSCSIISVSTWHQWVSQFLISSGASACDNHHTWNSTPFSSTHSFWN